MELRLRSRVGKDFLDDVTVEPLLQLRCDFWHGETLQFSVREGQMVWLKGASGVGKTSIARVIAGIDSTTPFQAKITTTWRQHSGGSSCTSILFQDSILLNELTVSDNIHLAARRAGLSIDANTIDNVLESVGLESRVAQLMPDELSGGMRKRAAFAQIMTLQRRLVILDEPFVGSDPVTIKYLTAAIQSIKENGTAVIIISHQSMESLSPEICVEVPEGFDSSSGKFQPPTAFVQIVRALSQWRLFQFLCRVFPRYGYTRRTFSKIFDFIVLSLPLVVMAGVLVGTSAITVLIEVMHRLDSQMILKHLPKSLTDSFMFGLVKGTITSKADEMIPIIKHKLVTTVLAYVVVVEIAPLLTAFLMAGRIGASHAGDVSTLRTSGQSDLLKTLGIRATFWTFIPAAIACLVAGPILTFTMVISIVRSVHEYAATETSETGELLWADTWEAITEHNFRGGKYYHHGWDTWPLFIMLYRSVGFHLLIVIIAEICGSGVTTMESRQVPRLITLAVVCCSLAIIAADWGFAQLLVDALLGVKLE